MKETSPVKRRLTAILAADAVGYSARMGEDEERTLRTLAGHRRHIDNLIADHGGRLVSTAGDSVLAEFGSSVEAVRCPARARVRRARNCHPVAGSGSAPAPPCSSRLVAGEVIIALGEPGQPGYIDLRGRPDADGTLVLNGFIIPAIGRARGIKINARYEGRLTVGRGTLTGNQGILRCSLGLQLR